MRLRVWGCRFRDLVQFWGFGFNILGRWFRFSGMSWRVQGLVSMACCLRFRVMVSFSCISLVSRFSVSALSIVLHVSCFAFHISRFGFVFRESCFCLRERVHDNLGECDRRRSVPSSDGHLIFHFDISFDVLFEFQNLRVRAPATLNFQN